MAVFVITGGHKLAPDDDCDRELRVDLKTSQEESYHRLIELTVLYETAPVGLGFLDHGLRYVRLNQALAEINGVSIQAHIGRLANEVNPELAKIIEPLMTQVLASREPLLHVELKGHRPKDSNDERFWIASFYPVANGGTFGVSVSFQDVTVLKASENLQRRFAAIVESSDDAMISLNLNSDITSWNLAAQRMFGYRAVDVMGKPISILAAPSQANPDQGNEMPYVWKQLQANEAASHYETVHRCIDGRYIDVSLTVSLIYDWNGSVMGASQTMRDVTQQRRNRNALLRTNEELRQFAFAAAHDLQEPLRNISLCAQMLSAQNQSGAIADVDQSLALVLGSANRMQTLVRDLLLYTEVVTLQDHESNVVDCNVACQAALQNLATLVDQCEARIRVSTLPKVSAKSVHLTQLFQNLIGNAVKYRSEERQAEVHVFADRIDNQWVFSVRDNGIGIASEFHTRIFEVFKRLHGRDIPGTGIGLSICKRIIDHYDGRLWLESKVGEGSTFRFSLPYEKDLAIQ